MRLGLASVAGPSQKDDHVGRLNSKILGKLLVRVAVGL